MLSVRTSHYSIRSVESLKLDMPSIKKKTFAARSFGVAGPTVWNDLPPNIRTIHDFNVFKHSVKTHYFTNALK